MSDVSAMLVQSLSSVCACAVPELCKRAAAYDFREEGVSW